MLSNLLMESILKMKRKWIGKTNIFSLDDMTTDSYLLKARTEDPYSYDLPNRYMYDEWSGWRVGAYVYAWLPTDPAGSESTWRKHPVLLVDIRKEKQGQVQFVIAHLYDRDAIIKRLKNLVGIAWLSSYVSSRHWPTTSRYILSNHFELVYAWELRTWSRSDIPSVSTVHIYNTHKHSIQLCALQSHTDIGRAFGIESTFVRFLQLPREVRDIVYAHSLIDEIQKTSRSLIHIDNLQRRNANRRLPRHELHNTGALPQLQSPGMFRVSHQVRNEALAHVYRSKILVLGFDHGSDSMGHEGLPDVARFLHIRIELSLDLSAASSPPRSFYMLELLKVRHLLSLHIRVDLMGYSPETSCADVASRVGGFTALLQNLADKSSRTIWGITDEDKKAGDYSCGSIYLSTISLEHMWSCANNIAPVNTSIACRSRVRIEDCRALGCRLHVH